jgi:hypothetical protein
MSATESKLVLARDWESDPSGRLAMKAQARRVRRAARGASAPTPGRARIWAIAQARHRRPSPNSRRALCGKGLVSLATSLLHRRSGAVVTLETTRKRRRNRAAD